MKPSALQLKHYILTELSLSANRSFDPGKKVQLALRDIVAAPECRMARKEGRECQIVLRIKHSQSAESNSPYFFMIEMIGFFAVSQSVPDDRVAEFAEVNGSSVLYSTAREVLRAAMALGPYLPILLPAVCFFDPKPKRVEKKGNESETGAAPGATMAEKASIPAKAKKAEGEGVVFENGRVKNSAFMRFPRSSR